VLLIACRSGHRAAREQGHLRPTELATILAGRAALSGVALRRRKSVCTLVSMWYETSVCRTCVIGASFASYTSTPMAYLFSNRITRSPHSMRLSSGGQILTTDIPYILPATITISKRACVLQLGARLGSMWPLYSMRRRCHIARAEINAMSMIATIRHPPTLTQSLPHPRAHQPNYSAHSPFPTASAYPDSPSTQSYKSS
jgi:hypothetical protein